MVKKKNLLLGESRFGIGHLSICSKLIQVFDCPTTFATATNIPPNIFDFSQVEIFRLPGIDTNEHINQSASLLYTHVKGQNYASVCLETWPFGRRGFDNIYEPTLKYLMHCGVRIYTSIRDILYPNINPLCPFIEIWAREIIDKIRKYNIRVLVHGDENFIDFGKGFPLAKELKKEDRLHYTGYLSIDSSLKKESTRNYKENILVTAGSGKVGMSLYKMVLAGIGKGYFDDYTVLIVAGPWLNKNSFITLREFEKSYSNLRVESSRRENGIFQNINVSISQSGYGTSSNILTNFKNHLNESSHLPVTPILVPWSDKSNPAVPHKLKPYLKQDGLTEQELRAKVLASNGLGIFLQPGELTIKSLAESVIHTLSNPLASKDIGYFPKIATPGILSRLDSLKP
ncbi:putative glycosyl transferase [Leptolyngbya sp. PCC 7375]|nr:putative glycosyl transferase [Leptolyngbya sp. PCC 7375]